MSDVGGTMSHNGGRKVIGALLPEAVTSLRIGQLPIGPLIGHLPLGAMIGGAALAGIGDGVTGEEAQTCR